MLSDLLLNVKNIPGPSSNRRILVLECDDWGGIRMPSKKIYEIFHSKGLIKDFDRYAMYDTLAGKDDLEAIFEVLLSYRDRNGKPAIMTPVTNVANPDFERIKEAGFTKYFYEPFTVTLDRYNRDSATFMTWLKGLELGIFVPELHGREHITVYHWLMHLRTGAIEIVEAFNNGLVAINYPDNDSIINGFRPEYYFDDKSQVDFLKDSITDGIRLFESIFGYTPRAFVPSNNLFHPIFEPSVAKTGVRFLYVSHIGCMPGRNGKLLYRYYRNGKLTKDGLRYYTRNCAFEPSDFSYSGIDKTIKQIETAFRWNKPAIISTHRVNFVGALNKENRSHGLKELGSLLKSALNRWPDLEFMSSGNMLETIYGKA